MLNVLLHSGFGNTLVVVTRYFGGIKLGAGGLVRAYTQSVSDALANTTTALVTIRERLNVKLQYTDLASFEHRLAQHNATIDAREFTEQVQLVLAFPATARDEIEKLLMTFGAQWSEHTEAEA